jgi:hypothetical protein
MAGDGNSLYIEQDKYTYEVTAGVCLIPGGEQDRHAGQWEAVVTICRTCCSEPDRAVTFPAEPVYGATEEEARQKCLEYGRKLVLRAVKGLTI